MPNMLSAVTEGSHRRGGLAAARAGMSKRWAREGRPARRRRAGVALGRRRRSDGVGPDHGGRRAGRGPATNPRASGSNGPRAGAAVLGARWARGHLRHGVGHAVRLVVAVGVFEALVEVLLLHALLPAGVGEFF